MWRITLKNHRQTGRLKDRPVFFWYRHGLAAGYLVSIPEHRSSPEIWFKQRPGSQWARDVPYARWSIDPTLKDESARSDTKTDGAFHTVRRRGKPLRHFLASCNTVTIAGASRDLPCESSVFFLNARNTRCNHGGNNESIFIGRRSSTVW